MLYPMHTTVSLKMGHWTNKTDNRYMKTFILKIPEIFLFVLLVHSEENNGIFLVSLIININIVEDGRIIRIRPDPLHPSVAALARDGLLPLHHLG